MKNLIKPSLFLILTTLSIGQLLAVEFCGYLEQNHQRFAQLIDGKLNNTKIVYVDGPKYGHPLTEKAKRIKELRDRVKGNPVCIKGDLVENRFDKLKKDISFDIDNKDHNLTIRPIDEIIVDDCEAYIDKVYSVEWWSQEVHIMVQVDKDKITSPVVAVGMRGKISTNEKRYQNALSSKLKDGYYRSKRIIVGIKQTVNGSYSPRENRGYFYVDTMDAKRYIMKDKNSKIFVIDDLFLNGIHPDNRFEEPTPDRDSELDKMYSTSEEVDPLYGTFEYLNPNGCSQDI